MNLNDFDDHVSIAIQLLIRGEMPPLMVEVRLDPVILGRYDPEAMKQPEIDLTKYNAHEDGVSRLHAELLLHEDRVCVQDLSSRNGTYVNNEKLAPYIEHPLCDGDWLKLGRLKILINFLD